MPAANLFSQKLCLTWAFALLLMASPFASAPLSAKDRFGAIVFSPSNNRVFTATNKDTRDRAADAAVRLCRKHTVTECLITVSFKTDQCAALAIGKFQYSDVWAARGMLIPNYDPEYVEADRKKGKRLRSNAMKKCKEEMLLDLGNKYNDVFRSAHPCKVVKLRCQF